MRLGPTFRHVLHLLSGGATMPHMPAYVTLPDIAESLDLPISWEALQAARALRIYHQAKEDRDYYEVLCRETLRSILEARHAGIPGDCLDTTCAGAAFEGALRSRATELQALEILAYLGALDLVSDVTRDVSHDTQDGAVTR